jgi:hypothetical protein
MQEMVRGRGVLRHAPPPVEEQDPCRVAVGGFAVGFEAEGRRAQSVAQVRREAA